MNKIESRITLLDTVDVGSHYQIGHFLLLLAEHLIQQIKTFFTAMGCGITGHFAPLKVTVKIPHLPERKMTCNLKWFPPLGKTIKKKTPSSAYTITSE